MRARHADRGRPCACRVDADSHTDLVEEDSAERKVFSVGIRCFDETVDENLDAMEGDVGGAENFFDYLRKTRIKSTAEYYSEK
eukprot:519334-Pyramimonas_sp.AAC.1